MLDLAHPAKKLVAFFAEANVAKQIGGLDVITNQIDFCSLVQSTATFAGKKNVSAIPVSVKTLLTGGNIALRTSGP